ncbi:MULTISPECIES: Z1 domain-containing protein [Marinobacter]|uniref:Endonuclease n=1 Tax=Marinobacter nauticus TaxID=2743 RepID=A0A833JQA1_MARNT|nr:MULTISPECIES: Z1 domain-containing protein [Marinobacter]KAE8546104.1 Endonuclease [Marinobacter nauticus]
MNNSSSYDRLIGVVESALFNQPRKTEEELRSLIGALATPVAPDLSPDQLEQMAREVEAKQGIKAGLGAVVDSDDFEPWLDDAKARIEPFYWQRYQKLLLQNGLPRDVVTSTDKVTDKILGRLGDPEKQVQWDRRGMVVGHVQSGKTANYTGLICKAADAGYRLIIVIAGIHNNLRNQTQARIDEGFIGRDTGRTQEKGSGSGRNKVGVGHFDFTRTPVSLTNTIKDFNKETASTNTSEIDSYKVPVVLVIKKNHRTLGNLLDWLRDNSARGDLEMIDQPMLLVDDEADNASINTAYNKNLITKINGQIRDLLNMFHRSCYVGYTATPFANIFIDPDEDDEMFNEDLFPRDFIIGLDAPTNYFGPSKIFIDGIPENGDPEWLRYIKDNEDILPIKHKIDHELDEIPKSLLTALRAFLLSRTIRDLRGSESSHCSMLVNASRFTAVQSKLRNRIHEALDRIKDSVRVNASLGDAGLSDPELSELKRVWQTEYSGTEFEWEEVQAALLESIAAAKVVEVNSRANDLDYTRSVERGQTVIAVGGFSLSRGLTLEGLTVTWFLRNTMMYDTLMQMGRWFGYRDGYEDLCRIWMPEEAIDWYAFIAEAAEELHDELKTMEKAKATPKMFGLAVRSHPASLLVTARNKMGASSKVVAKIGLSNQFIETAKVSISAKDIYKNKSNAKSFVESVLNLGLNSEQSKWGYLWRDVPVREIDRFLVGWRNAEQSVTTDTAPVRAYINARVQDELAYWDVLVTSKRQGEEDNSLGLPIIPAERSVTLGEPKLQYMAFSGKGMRLASRGIEKAGLSEAEIIEAESAYLEINKSKVDKGKVNFPDHIYRKVRKRGLFILHLVSPKIPDDEKQLRGQTQVPGETVVGWGMSLPRSLHSEETVEYVVNAVRYKELFGDDDEDEDQESDDDGNN